MSRRARANLPRRVLEDDPRAHAFAQALGRTVLAGAALAFALGGAPLGAVLTLVVVGLALLNLTTGFCLGCQLYFHYRLLRHRLSR